MTHPNQNLNINKVTDVIVFLVSALCMSFIALYSDEGANSLEWLKKPNGWLSLTFLTSIIVFGQLAVSRFMLKKYDNNTLKIVISIIAGPLLIISIFGVLIWIKKILI